MNDSDDQEIIPSSVEQALAKIMADLANKKAKKRKNVPFLAKSGENICKYGSFVVHLQRK